MMTTYEKDLTEHSPELRFDMGFTSYPVSTPEAFSSGMTYSDYDWTPMQGCVQPGANTLYSTHDSMEPQYGAYLGYGLPQSDIGLMPNADCAQSADIIFGTSQSHVPYTDHENFYSAYAAISPSSTSSSSGSTANGQKPKRKRIQSLGQRKAANVRERRRMFHLNEAFDELRKRLPAFNYEKRLSRIETLRLAMTYIAFMKDVSAGKEPNSVQLLRIQRKSEFSCEDSNESD